MQIDRNMYEQEDKNIKSLSESEKEFFKTELMYLM